MIYIENTSGTNINVQIFDTAKLDLSLTNLESDKIEKVNEKAVLFVMDYTFSEQAYETIDHFLKPYGEREEKAHLNIESISIMGKAGILEGAKGDITIPSTHIFEVTADNYPLKNELSKKDLDNQGVEIFEGSMIIH